MRTAAERGRAEKSPGKTRKVLTPFWRFGYKERFTLHNSTDSTQLIQLILFIFIHEKEIHFAIRIL
jgi:hypothetical protein